MDISSLGAAIVKVERSLALLPTRKQRSLPSKQNELFANRHIKVFDLVQIDKSKDRKELEPQIRLSQNSQFKCVLKGSGIELTRSLLQTHSQRMQFKGKYRREFSTLSKMSFKQKAVTDDQNNENGNLQPRRMYSSAYQKQPAKRYYRQQWLNKNLPNIDPTSKKSIVSKVMQRTDNQLLEWYQIIAFSKSTSDRLNRLLAETTESELAFDSAITAKAYFTVARATSIGFCKNWNKKMQIASLTKVLTCLTVLYCCWKMRISLQSFAKVSQNAAGVDGTDANLAGFDKLTIKDLLYGLMLPSGNDAALALAEHIGKALHRDSRVRFAQQKQLAKSHVLLFIDQMNWVAKQLGLTNSNFASCHGLNNQSNYSTAKDVTVLSLAALKSKQFAKIVQTREHSVTVYNQRTGLTRRQTWVNSNKLLVEQGYFGIKTGSTPAAGSCFAGLCRIGGEEVVAVVLDSLNNKTRFEEAHLLTAATLFQLGVQYPQRIQN